MSVRLCVLSPGKWQSKSIPIRSFPFLIGRGVDCQLRPASSLVSERHCALVVRQGRVVVEDLGSTNGTLVDGQAIAAATELEDQQRLQIGPIEFQIVLRGGPPAAAPQMQTIQESESSTIDDEAAAVLLAGDNDEVVANDSAPEPSIADPSKQERVPAPHPAAAPTEKISAA